MPKAQYAQQGQRAPVLAFSGLWEQLHGPGAWEQNPFVAVISFRVIRSNIDSAEVRGT